MCICEVVVSQAFKLQPFCSTKALHYFQYVTYGLFIIFKKIQFVNLTMINNS